MTKPSYKTHDPKGWCGDPSRGAALGRHSYHNRDKDEAVKLFLSKVRIDNGGYDSNGTYFGHDIPLYWYADEDLMIDDVLRAKNRNDAKQQILEKYPNAKFFN